MADWVMAMAATAVAEAAVVMMVEAGVVVASGSGVGVAPVAVVQAKMVMEGYPVHERAAGTEETVWISAQDP